MSPERFQQIESHGGVLALGTRAKFRLTGADRVRYLNGQVTQDVRGVGTGEARYSLITDHKARVLTDLFFRADGSDAILIDAEPDTRELLAVRLERYMIADDVELADVSDDWDLLHFFGEAQKLAAGRGVIASRLGELGLDVWVRRGVSFGVPGEATLSRDEHETMRILRQIPRWPRELNGDTFPAEASLQDRAVSFGKGCYIGQEIISRMKLTGKMPRCLVAWESEADVPAGATVCLPVDHPEAGKTIGSITSVTRHPVLGHTCGLAYLRQGYEALDSALLAAGEPPTLAPSIRLLRPAS